MSPPMPSRVLVVEDELLVREGLEDRLRIAGYDVETAEDGVAGWERALEGGFHAIVLDLVLPGKDGLSICAGLRHRGVDTPILMLTAKKQLDDRLRGFSAGADDYLTKPFDAMELLARMRVLLSRRIQGPQEKSERIHLIGGVRVSASSPVVRRAGKTVALTAKEHALLLYFLEHPRETLSRERLIRRIWASTSYKSTRTLDVHVASLRKKIEDDPANPRWIQTVYGVGYEFAPD